MEPKETQVEEQEETAKPWQVPQLVIYGTVESLTQGGGSAVTPSDTASGVDLTI